MIWITWRRYRVRIILLALYVVALIIFMIVTEQAYQGALTSCGHLRRIQVDSATNSVNFSNGVI